MKKILSIVVILLMVAFVAGVSYAGPYGDSRIGDVKLMSKTVYNNTTENYGHTHITTSPTSVYRISYSVPTASCAVVLYDNATTGNYATTRALTNYISTAKTGGNAVIKTCPVAAAADTQYTITYDPPLQFDYGVLVGFPTNAMSTGYGAVTVEYRQD